MTYLLKLKNNTNKSKSLHEFDELNMNIKILNFVFNNDENRRRELILIIWVWLFIVDNILNDVAKDIRELSLKINVIDLTNFAKIFNKFSINSFAKLKRRFDLLSKLYYLRFYFRRFWRYFNKWRRWFIVKTREFDFLFKFRSLKRIFLLTSVILLIIIKMNLIFEFVKFKLSFKTSLYFDIIINKIQINEFNLR